LKILRAYAGILVNAMMIDLFALLVGGSIKMAMREQMPTTLNHGQKI
jgi:hypothetical protein